MVFNVTYYRSRRELLDLFNECMAFGVEGDRVSVSSQLVVTIRTFLTSRSDSLNDDKRLAFETALVELLSILERPQAVLQMEDFVVPGMPEMELVQSATPEEVMASVERRRAALAQSRASRSGRTPPQPFLEDVAAHPNVRFHFPKGRVTFRVESAPSVFSSLAGLPEQDVSQRNPAILQAAEETQSSNQPVMAERLVDTVFETVEANSEVTYRPTRGVTREPVSTDLADKLRRPNLFSSGLLGSGAGPSSYIFTVSSLTMNTFAVNTVTLFPQVKYWRATMVFKLVVPSTPDASGILGLSFMPRCGSAIFERCFAPTWTHLPHVLMDRSKESSVEFRIPWYLPVPYVSNSEPLGTITLHQYLPCTDGTFNVYCWLEDVETHGVCPTSLTNVTLQSGVSDEDESLLSSRVNHVATAFHYVARAGIPIISGFASTASWATGIVSRTLKSLGFSVSLAPRTNVVLHVPDVPGTSDGARVLSTSTPYEQPRLTMSDNTLHTNEDQMSLAYITRRPSVICRGSFSTTTGVNSLVYACTVGPSAFWYRSNIGLSKPAMNIPLGTCGKGFATLPGATNGIFFPSNLLSMSSLHKYWRGDIVFRIRFAKSMFHNAILNLTFAPDEKSWATTSPFSVAACQIATSNSFDGLSQICELRSDMDYCDFVVPYTSSTNYTAFPDTIGTFAIFMETPLTLGSSTVAPNVYFSVEVFSNNFELIEYAGPVFCPVNVLHGKNGAGTYSSSALAAVATLQSSDLPFSDITPNVITSLKQAISMTYHYFLPNTNVTANSHIMRHAHPWWIPKALILTMDTAPNIYVTSLPSGALSPQHFVASHYAFAKGSTDYYLTGTPTMVQGNTVYERNSLATAFAPAGWPSIVGARPSGASDAGISGSRCRGFKVFHTTGGGFIGTGSAFYAALTGTTSPFANAYRRPFGRFNDASDYSIVPFQYLSTYYPAATTNGSNANFTAISQCAGDDAYCTFYLGPPPLCFPLDDTAGSLQKYRTNAAQYDISYPDVVINNTSVVDV